MPRDLGKKNTGHNRFLPNFLSCLFVCSFLLCTTMSLKTYMRRLYRNSLAIFSY